MYDFKENVALTFLGSPVVPNGRFVVLFMHVKNPGTMALEVSAIYSFVLADNQNRQYDLASTEAQIAAEDQYHLGGTYDDIQPGLTRDLVFVFDVATNAQGFRLVPIAP